MLTLVVEDDQSYSDIISHTLQRASHDVVAVSSVREAIIFAKRKTPDIAVLDVSLPDGTGMDACALLREIRGGMPIIMLSALDRSADIVAGLDAGADDYLTKPFHPNELLARVNALLRRTGIGSAVDAHPSTSVSALGFSVDTANQVAELNGIDLACTRIEIDILGQLVRYPGQALTHGFLTEVVWGYKNMADATLLKGHISAIRKKVRDAGGDPEVIRTVHGVGYSLSVTA